ncbi:hypothetical protein D3C85_1735730 [compost metagenome]
MAALQLADQLFGQGEVFVRAIRMAHHRASIFGADRRQGFAHEIAHCHVGLGMDAPGHFPSQLTTGRGQIVGAAFEQQDARHGETPGECEGWRK